jgi:2-iminobutanoate/2-iminopropanoate deaminase
MKKGVFGRMCTALLASALLLPDALLAGESGLHQIQTTPDPYAQYGISQAIRVGNLVFVSGQVGMDLEGRIVGDDFDAQAEQAFRMLGLVLEAGGSGLDRVAKVTIYVTDMSKFPTIVRLREKYFKKPYPADTIVEVSALGLPGLKIEIEAIGVIRP